MTELALKTSRESMENLINDVRKIDFEKNIKNLNIKNI